MKVSGVYAIKNTANGKIYIGQTIDLRRRIYDHGRNLLKGIHHNVYLQREYKKYGESKFEFDILEECPTELLDEKEIYWIGEYHSIKSSNGYNLEGGGNSGKFVTEQAREKKCGANNPMYGKKLSSEHIQSLKIKNRSNSKVLTEKDVFEIKERVVSGDDRGKIANKYNISRCTVDKIVRGNNWEWVHSDLNKKLASMVEKDRAERNKKIFELNSKGISRAKISKAVGCTPFTVARILGTRTSEILEERDGNIVQDFKSGMSKKYIMEKYKICSAVYVKVTKEAYNEKAEQIKSEAVRMRIQGMAVKDIAKELGYARTTISKWTMQYK